MRHLLLDVRPRYRVLYSYLSGRGDFPMQVTIRTPMGPRAVMLPGPHDVLTLNEIFCRRDYPLDHADRVVVDIGANIGLAALFFLTRNPDVICECYEPVPRNTAYLHATLHGLEQRYRLHEVSVADRNGNASFGIEPTGRYGGISLDLPERITVPCVHINDVLTSTLATYESIDILKVDIEGAEGATMAAADPELLARVRHIYIEEDPKVSPIVLPGFRSRRIGSIVYYAVDHQNRRSTVRYQEHGTRS